MTERAKDGETEAAILSAAHTVFVKRGTSGARMQEIADEAGVNKALLHYYFRSKDRLAEAVFRRSVRQILPRVFGILATEGTLEAKVREVIAAEFEFLRAHPYLPGYVISELNYHPKLILGVFGETAPVPLDRLEMQLKAEAAAGRIRPIGADQFVANLMSLIMFPFVARPLLTVMVGRDPEEFEAFLAEREATLGDFFLGGLRG